MRSTAHTHPSLREISYCQKKTPTALNTDAVKRVDTGCLASCSVNGPACLIMLQESETVYFEESLKTAQGAVAEALGQYNALVDSLNETERGKLQRSMGMKMEQLKVRWKDGLHPGQLAACFGAMLALQASGHLRVKRAECGESNLWRAQTAHLHGGAIC